MDRTKIPNFKLLTEYAEEINANTMTDVSQNMEKANIYFTLAFIN